MKTLGNKESKYLLKGVHCTETEEILEMMKRNMSLVIPLAKIGFGGRFCGLLTRFCTRSSGYESITSIIDMNY